MRATVPVRTCDIGGWTDTWFGGPGRVVNVAVGPGIEVTVARCEVPTRAEHDRLVRAALHEYPTEFPVDVRVSAAVPPGCALGTSSAVAVALVAALGAIRGEQQSRTEIAREAHRLETEVLGEECGVQDQLAAVHGGISHVTVDRYPVAQVESLPAWPELGTLLTTVYLGKSHLSSEVHRQVIGGADRTALEAMRAAADSAREAVLARDLAQLADAMRRNADAQRDLHPGVVGRDAVEAIEAARASGALAWKVNGAGGDGGSLAVLHGSLEAREAFEALVNKSGRWRVLDLQPADRGLEVEISPGGS